MQGCGVLAADKAGLQSDTFAGKGTLQNVGPRA